MSEELVIIGKVVAPHGVRGDVRVIPLTDFPDRFLNMKSVLVGDQRLPIESAKFHKQFLILKFRGLDDRNSVEQLRGSLLQVQKKDAVPLEEGRYYVFDIVGMSVYTADGRLEGVITDVISTGSNDVYVVERQGGRALLVPALKKIVASIDVAGKRMVIQNPEEWDADED